MPDDPHNLVDLPTTHPAEAFGADVARLRRASIGALDDAWLTLAHTLHRLPTLSVGERGTMLPGAADALAASALTAGVPTTAPMLRVATALQALTTPSAETTHAVVTAVQAAVDELEMAGGFNLAYATLVHLELSLGETLTPRERGGIMAQQGRTLRQAGRVDLALELYTATLLLGREHEAHDIIARGLLGEGVVALTRGNYPDARDRYQRALANADVANDKDLLRLAHHGLMSCGFASGDLDAAMVHGWNVLRLSMDPEGRAEAMLNLGEVCRLAGETEVAMRVFSVARQWTSVPRVRLHAASSALLAAATLGRVNESAELIRDMEALLSTIADTLSVAGCQIEFAEALQLLGHTSSASAHLERGHTLAVEHAYHELVHLAEQVAARWEAEGRTAAADLATSAAATAVTPPSPTRRSEPYKVVLRSLKGLTAAAL